MANVDLGDIQPGPDWLIDRLPEIEPPMNILIIHKTPKIETVSDDVLEKFEAAGITSREVMEKSAKQHYETLEDVIFGLERCSGNLNVQQVALPEYDAWASQNSMDDIDLILTVGGDGTVLGASRHIKSTPVISINSDPDKSVGALTRFTRLDWYSAFLAFQDYHACERSGYGYGDPYEYLWRLEMTCGDTKKVFLNDVLLTNENPAEMSIYQVDWPQKPKTVETQFSSGVWISTATGATGGYSSAGGYNPCNILAESKFLLWKVREPCKVKIEHRWLMNDWQEGDGIKLDVMAVTPLAAYVDGSHDIVRIDSGETVSFKLSREPLRLYTDVV